MHNLVSKMARLEALSKSVFANRLTPQGNLQRYPRLPKAPDTEIIALSLAAYLCGIHSENQLYTILKLAHPALFERMPCRQSYNRRVKHLRNACDELAIGLSEALTDPTAPLIVDSTPLPICRFIRAPRLKICQDDLSCLPRHGRSAIDKLTYFGFKLHLACCPQGVVQNYFIAPANRSDISQLASLTHCLPEACSVLGDKGYISGPVQLALFQEQKIVVSTPLRRNQRAPGTWTRAKGRVRRRIETLFSQLLDQFALRLNYSKTTLGLFTKLSFKICALTCLQFFNFEAGLPLGNLKSQACFQ
jgi:hypothetical protein